MPDVVKDGLANGPRQTNADGSFKRQVSAFRNFISAEPGSKFAPEKGRYHLYVSWGCPWAHRTLLLRKLKGLEDFIDVTFVSPHMSELGWAFAAADPFPGAEHDPIFNAKHARDIYFRADPNYNARFTVPFIWDKKENTILNNESSEIIRMFNSEFNGLLPEGSEQRKVDLYPEEFRKEIDEQGAWVYNDLSNGVYKAGFAANQTAYETAVVAIFEALDKLEKILEGGKDYLIGDRLTEADVSLYVSIIRFDVAYHGPFKCNLGTIRHDYPNIHQWVKKLYWKNPIFKETTNFHHIKEFYYWPKSVNPSQIVPKGPKYDIEPLSA